VGNFAQGGGLNGPGGMVFGPNGDLLVSNFSTNQVLRYDGTTGAFVGVFAQGGGMVGPGDLLYQPVPEPSGLLLLALPATVVALRRVRRVRAAESSVG
jgi:hypothetical protein